MKKTFQETQISFPYALKIKYFWTLSYNFWGFLSITKLSQTSRKRYAQKMCGSANFDNLDKGLGIVSPSHFVYDLSTKMFLMLCSIN